MEVIDGMTPEQLRAMADQMDGAGKRVKTVVVDGVGVDIDMRAVEDVRTLSLVAKMEAGGPDSVFAAVELFDFILGDQRGKVVGALSDEDGYCSAADFSAFCAKVLQEVGAKN